MAGQAQGRLKSARCGSGISCDTINQALSKEMAQSDSVRWIMDTTLGDLPWRPHVVLPASGTKTSTLVLYAGRHIWLGTT